MRDMTRKEYMDELRAGVTNYALTVKQAIEAAYKHADETNPNGWHPASEFPPVDKFGESEYLIVYDLNGYAFSAFYSRKRGWCDDDGRDNLEIEWWCYPPKKE